MTANTTTLDDLLPLTTAGALPSSRTESMLQDALDSDNIDEVKAQLAHIWGHYQSLEFMLNAVASDSANVIETARNTGLIETVAEAEAMHAAFRIVAEVYLHEAYEAGHHSLADSAYAGITIPAALRQLYPQLDYRDPERELSDADLSAFFTAFDANALLADLEADLRNPAPRFETDASGVTTDKEDER